LAHNFKGFGPWLLGPIAWAKHHGGRKQVFLPLLVDRKQRKGSRTRYPQWPAPRDLLPPAKFYLLMFPEPPKSTTSWKAIF
jgi:hypothetical protein